MSRVDAITKSRNSLLGVTLLYAAISFGTVYAATGVTWLDYWLLWASLVTGIAAVITGIAAMCTHVELNDAQRTDRHPTERTAP